MSFGDFWIQHNNSRKERLQAPKEAFGKERLEPKFAHLFDFFDKDRNGKLNAEEMEFFAYSLSAASGDNILTSAESKTSIFSDLGEEKADFLEFVKAISDAVKYSKTEELPNGEKRIITEYKNGVTDTIYYYPNGDFKFKVTEKKNFATIDNPETELRKMGDGLSETRIKHNYQKVELDPDRFVYLSEQAAQEVQLKNFVFQHFIDTNQDAQKAIDSVEWLDRAGNVIKEGLEELGLGKDTNNLSKMEEGIKTNKSKADNLNSFVGNASYSADLYFGKYEDNFKTALKHEYSPEQAAAFQELTNQYQTATYLNQCIDLISKALRELENYETDYYQQQTQMPGDNFNPMSHINTVVETLTQLFDDNEIAKTMVNQMEMDNHGKFDISYLVEQLKEMRETNKDKLQEVLGARESEFEYFDGDGIHHKSTIKSESITYEKLKEKYIQEYKSMYNVDTVPEEVLDKVMTSKEIGGIVKIAIIMAIQMAITKQAAPVLSAGGVAAVDGASAAININKLNAFQKIIQGLIKAHGVQKVSSGLNFAVQAGFVPADIGLGLVNGMTSKEGLTEEKMKEVFIGGLHSAKYVGFGYAVTGRMSLAITQNMSKIGLGTRLFNGIKPFAKGQKVIKGADFVSKLNTGVMHYVGKGAAFIADGAAFGTFDALTSDLDLAEATENAFKMQLELGVARHFLETLLGVKVHARITEAKQRANLRTIDIIEDTNGAKAKYIVQNEGKTLFETDNIDVATTQVSMISQMGIENYIKVQEKSVQISEEGQKILDEINEIIKNGTEKDVERFNQLLDETKQLENPAEVWAISIKIAELVNGEDNQKEFARKKGTSDSKKNSFHIDFEEIEQQIQEKMKLMDLSGEERFMQFLKIYNLKEYDKLQKNPYLLETQTYKEQIADLDKLYQLKYTIEDCRDLRGTKEAEEIYENYLQNEYASENPKTAEHIKDICRLINKDFGVKVFLPSNLKEAGVALKLIYQELACYKMHAQENGAKAELPPTLEFFVINEFFVKDGTIVGGCSSFGDKSIRIRGLNVDIKSHLRHELAHANEQKHLPEFPEGFNPKQYEQIFREANISDESIEYGQTSPAEFLATAAQGDMSKYPPKLKEALKSLGMPEWMFNMPANFTQADIDKVIKSNLANKERGLDPVSLRILKAVFGDSMEFSISEEAKNNDKYIHKFVSSSVLDGTLSQSRINLTQFGKNGIPLKYSRENFIKELDALLSSLPPTERAKIEAKFGIRIENTTFNKLGKEVVGIPIIPEKLGGTEREKAVANLIRKFTVENEVQIADKETKELLESILQTFPEFAMTIGKKQHDTHNFSVDIHTLRNLQDNLANPKYAELDAESQLVLKYATILHDIGKRFLGDKNPDRGHEVLSTEYATKILERFDLSDEVKARIIKQVKNHHWFEEYNKGKQTPALVAKVVETFGTKEDFTIAEIMAKSDYMNVNEGFHLSRKRSRVAGNGLMSDVEFENFMTTSFEKIESQFNQGSGKINPNNTASNGQPRQKTAVDILSSKVENAQNRDEIVSLKQHIEELTDATEKAVLMDKYFETLQKFVSEKEADLIKKISNNEELKGHPVILKLLDKVLKREDHYVGDVPDNFFGWLLWKTDLDEVLFKTREKQYMKKEELRASDLIEVLNIFIDNPVLYKNQKICELMADKAGYSFYAPEHSKFVKEGLELYVKTKELQDNSIMQEYLEILFKDIDADKKLKLFNFINNHPNLFKPSIESFIQYSTNTDDFDTILELWGKNKNGEIGEIFRCIGSCEKDQKINNVRLSFLKKYGDISVSNITDKNYKFFMKLSENNISADFLKKYIDVLNENNLQSIQRLDKLGKISSEDIVTIARNITELNKELIENLCEQEDVSPRDISQIASGTRNKVALKFAKELCDVPDLPKHYISQILTYAQKDRIPLLRELCLDKDFREATGDLFGSTISYVCETNKELIKKMCKDRILDDRGIAFITARSQDKKDHDLIKKMYESEDIDKKYLQDLVDVIRDENIEYLEKFYFNKDISKELLVKIKYSLSFLGENNAQYAEHLLLNYEKFGIFEEQIGTLIERSFVNSNEAYDLNVISKLNQQLGKENVLKLSNIELVVCMNNINLIGKKSLNDLSKTEKRNLLNTLLVNKNNIESNYLANLKDIMPILPQSTEEYVRNIDLIKNGLHMNESDRLSVDAQKAFSKSLEDLSTLLKVSKGISDIHLSHSHKEFVEKINSILKDLPPEEQLKIQELFGFKIVNGKLTGYPNVNLSAENYTNKELFDKIKQEVETYLDNQVIIENNPQLSNILNGIIRDCPELLNQIDGSGDFTKVLQQLQITLSKKEFKDLSNDDKQIVILAHLFGNTDKHLNTRVDAACEGYFISQKLGLSKEMSQKLYAIIEMLNAPEEFMATSKKTTIRDYRGTILEGQERQDVFDLLAFKLKEGNLFNLTKLVYDSKYPEGFTDRFNNLLSHRIREIKANDFSLLQTASSTYRSLARRIDVLSNNKVYSVDVVNAEDIPNFYALAHTPEAGFASGGSRDANFANFKLFEMVGDDKVICTGYITAEKAGLVKSFHHGFIFEVPNDKQYVGYGTDIFSLGKTIPDMVVEYFRDRGYEANRNRGDKWSHRTFISKALKRELYGIVGSKLKGVDDKYIARLDNIKAKLGSKPLTLENLRQIDPEFADAYVRAINSKGWGIFYKKLLKEFEHNEVLVSNPKISAIFTDNIDNIPEEYLIKAQEENLPIVVIK